MDIKNTVIGTLTAILVVSGTGNGDVHAVAGAPSSSLTLAVKPSAPTYPSGQPITFTATVGNTSATACGVPARAEVSLTVTSATVGGRSVTASVYVPEYLDGYVRSRQLAEVSVASRGSTRFTFTTSAGVDGKQFLMLPGVKPLAGSSRLDLSAAGAYAVTFAYIGAPASPGECHPAAATATARFTVTAATAAGASAGPADGNIFVAGDRFAYDACVSNFTSSPGDAADVYREIQSNTSVKGIVLVDGGAAHPSTAYTSSKAFVVDWSTTSKLALGAVPEDHCATLYHELAHAAEQTRLPITSTVMCWQAGAHGSLANTGIPVREVEATRDENAYRTQHGLPVRTTYGGARLPTATTPCIAPPTRAGPPADPYPSTVTGTMTVINDPFGPTTGAVSFTATKVTTGCANLAACSYILVASTGVLHYDDGNCRGSATAPPWIGSDDGLPDLTLVIDHGEIDYSFYGHDEVQLTCDDGGSPTSGFAIRGDAPSAGVPWQTGQWTSDFALDGQDGTVSLRLGRVS